MKIIIGFIGLVAIFSGCTSGIEKETPSGLKFTVVESGDGVLPQIQEVVVFNYRIQDSRDSVWESTFEGLFPAAIMIADSSAIQYENGLIQLLRMVSKGDSISFKIGISEFFKTMLNAPVPSNLDSSMELNYRFRIIDFMSREEYFAFQDETKEKHNRIQLAKDVASIEAYLKKNNIAASKTESGIFYVITRPGQGETAKSGQIAKVNYSGYLLDGKYFDSSIKQVAEGHGVYNPQREPYEPYDVTIDESRVIKGWHEALKLMNSGARGTFFIPSILAYGPQKRGDIIKANSILVFDLEILELK